MLKSWLVAVLAGMTPVIASAADAPQLDTRPPGSADKREVYDLYELTAAHARLASHQPAAATLAVVFYGEAINYFNSGRGLGWCGTCNAGIELAAHGSDAPKRARESLSAAGFDVPKLSIALRRQPFVRFVGIALSEAYALLRDATDVNLLVDWAALATAGVTRAAKVTSRANEIPLTTWLTTMPSLAGAREPAAWDLIERVVVVSTRAGVALHTDANARHRRQRIEAATADDQRAAKALERSLPAVEFRSTRLEDVVWFLGDVSRVTVTVDWDALARIGIVRDTPVELRLDDVPVYRVLEMVCLSLKADGAVDYRIEAGRVVIGVK